MTPRQNKLRDILPVEKTITWREFQSDYPRSEILLKKPSKRMLQPTIDSDTGLKSFDGVAIEHLITGEKNGEKIKTKIEVIYDKDYVTSVLYELIENCGLIINGQWVSQAREAWFGEAGFIAQFASTEGAMRQQQELRNWAIQQNSLVPEISIEAWIEFRTNALKKEQDEAENAEKASVPSTKNGTKEKVKA